MIVKFNPAGRVQWVFGRRKESADEDAKPWEHVNPPLPPVDGMFRQPTDVAWDSAGQHLHQRRLHQFAGRQIRQERRLGEVMGRRAPARASSALPHAIAIDRNDNVYVGDRANHRIQVFDTDGKFLRMFTIDVPPDARHACDLRQHADRRAPHPGDRGAQFDLHHARTQPGDVRRRIDLPRTHLQGRARRQGAGRDRQVRDASSSSSPAPTGSPVRRRTRSTPPRPPTGGCRS